MSVTSNHSSYDDIVQQTKTQFTSSNMMVEETIQQLLYRLQDLTDATMSQLRQVSEQAALKRNPTMDTMNSEKAVAVNFQRGLKLISTWNLQIKLEEGNNAVKKYQYLPKLYRYACLRLFRDIFPESTSRNRQIKLKIPPFHDFLHTFYCNVAACDTLQNVAYYKLYGFDKKIVMVDALRSTLFQCIEGAILDASSDDLPEENETSPPAAAAHAPIRAAPVAVPVHQTVTVSPPVEKLCSLTEESAPARFVSPTKPKFVSNPHQMTNGGPAKDSKHTALPAKPTATISPPEPVRRPDSPIPPRAPMRSIGLAARTTSEPPVDDVLQSIRRKFAIHPATTRAPPKPTDGTPPPTSHKRLVPKTVPPYQPSPIVKSRLPSGKRQFEEPQTKTIDVPEPTGKEPPAGKEEPESASNRCESFFTEEEGAQSVEERAPDERD